MIKYLLAYRKKASLWHDPWCKGDTLWTNIEARNSLNHNPETTVSEIINSGVWNSIIMNLPDSELQTNFLQTKLNHYLEEDRIVWSVTTSREFKQNATYAKLKGTNPQYRQAKLIWGKWIGPKYSFKSWQLLIDCLPTQDRLVHNRILDSSNCTLGNSINENARHLFFDCYFSKELQSNVKAHIGLGAIVFNSNREWFCLLSQCGKINQPAQLRKAFLCVTVYAIWREQNKRRFLNTYKTEDTIIKQLLRNVKNHLSLILQEAKDTIKM